MSLLVLGLLLFLTAFFAAGEISILRLRPSRVQRLVEEGKPGSNSINRIQKRLRKALMLSQLGVTISLVALGWMGKGLGERLWENENPISSIWDTSLFLVIVFLAAIISGLLPKAVVLNKPEKAALKLAPLLEAVMRALGPVLTILESFASFILKIIGLNAKWDSLVPALSAGELETLIDSGGVTGLKPDEQNILEGVFALRDTQVREVMVPRSGMVTLSINAKFADLMQEVHKTRHARFLVIGESLDDVKGVIDLRELAEAISRGDLRAETPIKPYLKPAKMVLETSSLADLLTLIKNGHPLLVVVDEHGGTEGLVTAADLTGEIVGDEIEPENQEPELQSLDDLGVWLATGNLEIIEINRQLSLELPESDDHHTLAGFLLEKLQHIPIAGESLFYEGIKFEISRMQGPRIEEVKLFLVINNDETD